MLTHPGNVSHQIPPRMEDHLQAQVSEAALYASLNADGHHVPFLAQKIFARPSELERTILVSDAIMATDIGPGNDKLGNFEVVVSDTLRCTKAGHADLAGSALTKDLRVIHAPLYTDATFDEALAMASTRPPALARLETLPEVRVVIESGGFWRTA